LAMHLALRRASADGAPRDQIGRELRRDRVEELASRRHAHVGQVAEQSARCPQPLVDDEAAIEARIVDQPFPADGRPRLLEVHAHHDAEVFGQAAGNEVEAPGVVPRRERIVDRARADDHDQAIVLSAEDSRDRLAAARHRERALLAERQLLEQDGRRNEGTKALDAKVACGLGHGFVPYRSGAAPSKAGARRVCRPPRWRGEPRSDAERIIGVARHAGPIPPHPSTRRRIVKVGIALNMLAKDGRSDADVFAEHLAMGDLAEPLGFDSLWALEHHFTGYAMSPSPTHLLSYYAGRPRRIQLGTAVIVLPWHDPVRVAEEIALVDVYSGGRCLFGFGRGAASVEYAGFRVPMEEARPRFVEAA